MAEVKVKCRLDHKALAKGRMAQVVRKHHLGISLRKVGWPHRAKMAGGKDVCDFKKTEEIPGEDGKLQGEFWCHFRILRVRPNDNTDG
jgi:hypothetical protein